MANFKTVFYFSSQGGNTSSAWTESYTGTAPNLADAATFGVAFVASRCAMLNVLNIFRKARVSDLDNPRSSTVIPINAQGTNNDGGPSPPGSAAIVTLSSSVSPGATRKWALRGYSDENFFRGNTTGNDTMNPKFKVHLDDWIQRLHNDNYTILKLAPLVKGGPYPLDVSKAEGNADGTTKLTISANPGLNAGQRVILSRCSKKDAPGLNGKWQILEVAAKTITIKYQMPQSGTLLNVGGKLRREDYLFNCVITPAISGWSYLGSRQTRDYFNSVRGNRSANKGLRNSL